MFERVTTETEDYRFSELPTAVHHKIINYVGKRKKVLDIGCGSGYLGKAFKKNDCYVIGIESDQKRAGKARDVLDKIIPGDVENIDDLDLNEDFFDVIVLADVLEHLSRPDIVLINLKKYLKNDGCIIVSVPNVARIDSRLRLLFGKFEYENSGIFDKTHLRFFTEHSINRLLKGCGYSIVANDYSGLISKFRILRFLSGLLAFQFILIGKPNIQ